jgi:hypothetical protein
MSFLDPHGENRFVPLVLLARPSRLAALPAAA